MPLPTRIALEIVTPEGLLLREDVDEIVAPGAEGYFGVRPGHTPMMAALGLGELAYRKDEQWRRLTCFSGWCEVLPDRVNVLAEVGERGEDIDVEPRRDRRRSAPRSACSDQGRGGLRRGPPRLHARRDAPRRRPARARRLRRGRP